MLRKRFAWLSSVRSVQAAKASSEVVYRKLILWWALAFLSIGWIVFYVTNTITKNSAAILSSPLTLFALLSAATFLLLLVLFWSHNQFTYRRRYSQWERSFLCQRSGTLTEQE